MSQYPIILSNYNTDQTSSNNELRLRFNQSMSFKNKEVALGQLLIYYSWRNMTSTFGNLSSFGYIWGTNTYLFSFLPGYYSIGDISGYIQQRMKANGHYLVDNNGDDVFYLSIQENAIYYAATLTVTPLPSVLPSGWTNPASVVLSGRSPQLLIATQASGNLIGFNTGTFPPSAATAITYVNSTFTPQIHPVSTVNVNCDLVNNFITNIYPQVIYSFNADVAYGSQLIINPNNPYFFKALDRDYTEIRIYLTDQQNRPLEVLDREITAVLLLREPTKANI